MKIFKVFRSSSFKEKYGIKKRLSSCAMSRKIHLTAVAFIFILTVSISGVWYLNATAITTAEETAPEPIITSQQKEHSGNYVLIHLDTLILELKNGTTTEATFPIISQGKPKSYFETIGGGYQNDYKTPLHFSSIGHVYMPYSIHVFGNYFIHGVPYYKDGAEVSSSYSGGCIRLNTADARSVYNFVKEGTPIIITRGGEYDFSETKESQATTSIEMTRLMTVIVSLEFLTQDDEIFYATTKKITTRKDLIPLFLSGNNDDIGELFASTLGKEKFTLAMNQKAETLGMSHTFFSDTKTPSTTTEEDLSRFISYITTYKSFLVATTSPGRE